jgi:MoaA/NifB/PqqE/SkfB family radical SAM enzyme
VIGVRRQYLDVVVDRLQRGDAGALLGLGWRWLGTSLSRVAKKPLVGPTLGTLVVTYRCDLRCRVCDLPHRARRRRIAGREELDTAGLEQVLRDMRSLSVAGVGITGGEPMLRSDTPRLLAFGTRLGLHMHLNTDGFRVADAAMDLVRTGMKSANISLDGATAEEHDRARGRPGAFETARSGLAALRRARGGRSSPKLTAVTVLTAANLHRIGAVAESALSAGADRLGVIPVHDFGQGEDASSAEAVAGARAVLRDLHARGVLDNSLAYLDLLPRALRGEESPLACYAPHASVVVDCHGDVYPCFPLMERDEPVGRIPLVPLWRSEAYAKVRRELAACRACLWNCHTEMNLAMPQRTRAGVTP